MEKTKILSAILEELTENAKKISSDELERFADALLKAKRIFVAGAGRSGCVIRAFANRLMHLGFAVYVVGEITATAIQKGDVLVIGSGSGSTDSLVHMAKKAHKLGASVITVTIHPEAPVGSISDAYICIPGASPLSELQDTVNSVQPGSSAFEQMSWIVYDAVIMILMEKMNKTEAQMLKFHANLE